VAVGVIALTDLLTVRTRILDATRRQERVLGARLRPPMLFGAGRIRPPDGILCTRRTASVTDQERQKAEELIGRLETSVGAIFPRDGGNASLIATMIQTLNGLRSLLGIVRPH